MKKRTGTSLYLASALILVLLGLAAAGVQISAVLSALASAAALAALLLYFLRARRLAFKCATLCLGMLLALGLWFVLKSEVTALFSGFADVNPLPLLVIGLLAGYLLLRRGLARFTELSSEKPAGAPASGTVHHKQVKTILRAHPPGTFATGGTP